MIFAQGSTEITGYVNRYASAIYLGGGGYPPRSGLVQRQHYVGQILENGQFRVLKPARLCSTAEFNDFQLVSKRWSALSELERTLLIETYNLKKLPLDCLDADPSAEAWTEVAACLSRAGYLRWTDELEVVELTLVGEAELQHQLLNLGAGDSVLSTTSGVRIRHHGPNEHEIDLGRASTLNVNVDGMHIRIFTMPSSGVVVRVDHDGAHRVHMSRTDAERRFTQAYIDRVSALTPPEAVHIQIGDEE